MAALADSPGRGTTGAAQGARQQTIIGIARDDNVILGADAIKRYLQIKSWATLYRLVELYGLPAIKRPDGVWMTTVTAIDDWLFLAADADLKNRSHLRGTNTKLETALERIQRRINERDGSGDERDGSAEGGTQSDTVGKHAVGTQSEGGSE